MQKIMPRRGQELNKFPVDRVCSDSYLLEDDHSNISEDFDKEIRERQAIEMEKFGYPKEAVELMRNPQPVPPKTDGETTS